MRAMRRAGTTAGFLIVTLLPLAAAVSAEPVFPTAVPVAIAQPLGTMGTDFLAGEAPVLPEPGLLVLVATCLMGLAAMAQRTTEI